MHVLQVEPQLVENYVATGQLSLVFSPVVELGAGSLLASKTAECAGQQNPLAFWQMHELLFAEQSQLWNATPELMVQFATELGLDGNQLQSCLADPAIAAKIDRMFQARNALGIRTRPSFDLNGQIIQGALPYANFAQLLDQALAQ